MLASTAVLALASLTAFAIPILDSTWQYDGEWNSDMQEINLACVLGVSGELFDILKYPALDRINLISKAAN